MRMYAKQSGDTLEMQNRCAEIRLRAERRAGEMLRDMKESGDRHDGKGNNRKLKLHDATPKLTDLGIERTAAHRWQKLADAAEVEGSR